MDTDTKGTRRAGGPIFMALVMVPMFALVLLALAGGVLVLLVAIRALIF